MDKIISINKERIIEKMEKLTVQYQKELEEYKYKIELLENGLFNEGESLGTIVSKLYLLLNSVDAARVLNELGYRIKTEKHKGSNGERKYKARDVTDLIDKISKDKTVDPKLKKRVNYHRKNNLRCGWG